jgi:hypothetical protein
MGIYSFLADYGRSLVRPLLGLIFSIYIFHTLYALVLIQPATVSGPTFEHAVWSFTIANAVPFVGALTVEKEVKEIILCAGGYLIAQEWPEQA